MSTNPSATPTAFDVFADQIWTEVLAFQTVNRAAMKRVQAADAEMYAQVRDVEVSIDAFVERLQAEPDLFNTLVIFCQHRDMYLSRMSKNLAAAASTATKH